MQIAAPSPPYNSLLRHYLPTIGRTIHYGEFLVSECLIWHRMMYHSGKPVLSTSVMRFHCPWCETSQILRRRRSEQRKAVSVPYRYSRVPSRECIVVLRRSTYVRMYVYIYIRKCVVIFALTQRAARIVPIYRSLLGRNAERQDGEESALEKKEEENPPMPIIPE